MIVAERGIHTVELYWQGLSFASLQMIVDDLYDQKQIYFLIIQVIHNHL